MNQNTRTAGECAVARAGRREQERGEKKVGREGGQRWRDRKGRRIKCWREEEERREDVIQSM